MYWPQGQKPRLQEWLTYGFEQLEHIEAKYYGWHFTDISFKVFYVKIAAFWFNFHWNLFQQFS